MTSASRVDARILDKFRCRSAGRTVCRLGSARRRLGAGRRSPVFKRVACRLLSIFRHFSGAAGFRFDSRLFPWPDYLPISGQRLDASISSVPGFGTILIITTVARARRVSLFSRCANTPRRVKISASQPPCSKFRRRGRAHQRPAAAPTMSRRRLCHYFRLIAATGWFRGCRRFYLGLSCSDFESYVIVLVASGSSCLRFRASYFPREEFIADSAGVERITGRHLRSALLRCIARQP